MQNKGASTFFLSEESPKLRSKNNEAARRPKWWLRLRLTKTPTPENNKEKVAAWVLCTYSIVKWTARMRQCAPRLQFIVFFRMRNSNEHLWVWDFLNKCLSSEFFRIICWISSFFIPALFNDFKKAFSKNIF